MSNELLEVTINGDLSVADNVEAVCAATMERAKAALKDAGIEIVEVDGVKVAKGVTDSKDHKTLFTNLNKTAKFLSDQRIDFEKRLYEVPAVKRIVEAMKNTTNEVLALREPIWGKYNQIVDASKPPEEHFKVSVCFKDITMSELEKMKKKWAKDGVVTEVGSIAKVKKEDMARTKKVTSDYGKKYMLDREGTHFRLVATKEFWCGDYFVKRGSKGGLVDSPDNLSQDDSCWITKDACVYGNARIEGDALITDRAIVCADAIVRGKSIISDDCQVCGKSIVDGGSVVAGSIELVGVKLDGAMIKFCTKNGKLHINKYNQPNDLIIGIKTVVYDGKDKRENESEEDYRKRKFKEHENTYKEYCRIVGK